VADIQASLLQEQTAYALGGAPEARSASAGASRSPAISGAYSMCCRPWAGGCWSTSQMLV
jgi:hypothetical protein